MSDRSRRGDLVATLLIAALFAQFLFAQCTLMLLACFLIVSRLSRWHPLWLVLPALAGLLWLLAQGVKPAAAGYVAGASHLISVVARPGPLLARLGIPRAVFAGWRAWLSEQLPVAVIVAATQAALFAMVGRSGRQGPHRPGALVAARRRYLAVTLRRGELATADGCCLGIVASTGRRAAVAWAEVEAGLLCTSQDADAVSALGRDLAVGAIQHRKTVIIVDIDCHLDPAAPDAMRRPDPLASACAQVAAPLRRVGWPTDRYDPLVAVSPARAASLVMRMLDWAGVGHARRLFWASYLDVALTLISPATPSGGAGIRPLIDELCALMEPGALRTRFAALCGGPFAARDRPLAASSLAGRVSELAAHVDADPSILAPVAVQLAELSANVGQLMRTSAGADPISLAGAFAGREVVHFALDRLLLGRAAPMMARLAVADLIDYLAEQDDHGWQADCVVWVNGCEVIDHGQLAALVGLGARTGTAVVLGTASGPVAARLATDINVVAVRAVSPAELATPQPDAAVSGPDGMAAVLAELHGPECGDVLSLWVRRPKPRLVAGCVVR
jgi:hypothetical protein